MNPQAREVTEERIARFERLGGVDLAKLYPEERDPLLAQVHVGTAHLKKARFAFRCDLCGRIERTDSEMEPLCTGPSWTDDHEPTVMRPAR